MLKIIAVIIDINTKDAVKQGKFLNVYSSQKLIITAKK